MIDSTLNLVLVMLAGNVLAFLAFRWWSKRHPIKIVESKHPDPYEGMKAEKV